MSQSFVEGAFGSGAGAPARGVDWLGGTGAVGGGGLGKDESNWLSKAPSWNEGNAKFLEALAELGDACDLPRWDAEGESKAGLNW